MSSRTDRLLYLLSNLLYTIFHVNEKLLQAAVWHQMVWRLTCRQVAWDGGDVLRQLSSCMPVQLYWWQVCTVHCSGDYLRQGESSVPVRCLSVEMWAWNSSNEIFQLVLFWNISVTKKTEKNNRHFLLFSNTLDCV